MSIHSSYKKIFLLGFIITTLVAIPFSVYIAQKRQQTAIKATEATILSFDPTQQSIKVGDNLSLNIYLDPTSTNQVSFVKLSISYDSSKFATLSSSLTANPESSNRLTTIIDDPKYESGKASISLSIGADPANAIKTKTKIAILQLKAIAATAPTGPNITFDPAPNTQILSITSTDQTSENVLSTTIPAKITVTSVAISPTVTPALTSAPIPISGTVTPSLSPSSAPVCLNLEVNATNAAILSPIAFIASGNATNGTINKISFNFGDSIEDLEIKGEKGSSASGQITHTYKTPGIYTAYAIITDNNNNLSAQQDSCTKIITINSSNVDLSPQPSIQPLPCTDPNACGDGKTMFSLGALGIIITIIGGVLLLL